MPLIGLYRTHANTEANARPANCSLTVVVLTRPPRCVQVQPEWLTSRWQPSPSKHGVISHHCRDWTISTGGATQKRDRKRDRWGVGVSLSHPPVTVNNAPHWPHMLLYEFGCPTPGRLGPLCKWKRCPCWWVLKILDLDNLEWARKDRACIFRIKIMDEVRIEITTKIKIDIMINIRTKLNWL